MRKIFLFLAAMLLAVAVNAEVKQIVPGVNTLKAAVSAASAGDVIELTTTDESSIYYEAGNFDMKKDLTIKAAEGAKPIVALRYYLRVEGANVTFQGIKFDGAAWRDGDADPLGASDHCIRSHNNSTGEEVITIENCEFEHFPSYVIYAQRGNRKWGSIIVKNSLFINNRRSSIYVGYESDYAGLACTAVTVENSTFANTINDGNVDDQPVINVSNAAEEKNDQTVRIDHCTFYNYVKKASNGYTFVDVRKATDVAISNCIFAQPAEGMSGATYVYGGSIDNCLVFNASGHRSSSIVHNPVAGDPLFKAAASNDFTLEEGSPALNAGVDGSNLGDPRWWPAAAPEPEEPQVLYLKPGIWAVDDAKFAVWDITNSAWSEFMTLAEKETAIYTTTVAASAEKVIFVRLNASADAPDWTKKDNQTDDLDLEEGKDFFTITSWDQSAMGNSTGTWSKYVYVEPAKFYITGNAALVGSEKEWHADAIKSTEDSYVLHLAAGSYQMKVTLDGSWDGGSKGIQDLTERAKGIQDINEDNIGFILTEEGDVTVTYTGAVFKLEGSFFNNPIYKTFMATTSGWKKEYESSAVWDATNEKIVVNLVKSKEAQWQAQVWFKTTVAKADKLYDISLKIKANKAFDGVIAKWQNAQTIFSKEGISLVADEAYELALTDQIGKDGGDGMLIFDFGYAPEETMVEIYDIVITEKDAPELPDLADGFYLIGRIKGVDGWDIYGVQPEHKFIPNPDNGAEFMLDVELNPGDEIQVVNVLAKAITAWFPGGVGNNYVIDEKHAGAKTVFFRPDNLGGEGWHHGCIFIKANEGGETAVENAEAEMKAVKMIENGQIVIIKNGVRYNVLGAQF